MNKRNYKVYAGPGDLFATTRREFSVLVAEAGTNLIRQNESKEHLYQLLKQGPVPDIYDANNRLLDIFGTTSLAVRLRKISVTVIFTVCKTLAEAAVSGTASCNQYVGAIRTTIKLVELENGFTIPIVQHNLRTAFRKNYLPLSTVLENPKFDDRCSAVIKCVESINWSLHSQTGVKVVPWGHGLIIQ